MPFGILENYSGNEHLKSEHLRNKAPCNRTTVQWEPQCNGNHSATKPCGAVCCVVIAGSLIPLLELVVGFLWLGL